MKIVSDSNPIDLICFHCIHLRTAEDGGGCDAFPEGIPLEITEGDNQHKVPLPGQGNNIVFEPKE
jgi:hypothetical protein